MTNDDEKCENICKNVKKADLTYFLDTSDNLGNIIIPIKLLGSNYSEL